MPVVTVLMSCYNASAYLVEAIESVLSQTYGDFDVVAINDGSTDDTIEILRKYASSDGRITVLDKANTGLADSLNVGIHAARGQWIARMDADDIVASDRLTRQVSYVEKHPSVVLLGAGCTLIDTHGRRIRDYRYPSKHRALVGHMAFGGAAFPHSSAFFRRETTLRLGGYNRRFARRQDLDLWLRLSRAGEIAALSEPLVKKREHSAGISNDSVLAITMDLAARVCHFIRTREAPDPSWDGDEKTWRRFMDWLARWMEDNAYLEFQSEWFGIRREFQASLASRGRLPTALALGRRLFGSGYARRIIKDKLFGDTCLPRIADQWIHDEANGRMTCPEV